MKQKLLDILACPRCKGELEYDKKNQQLICPTDGLNFAIKDGIPELVVLDNDKQN
ncbi:MAG: Trm112 family protein [Gammaproteobacteria bacterium]|jgi:uncharacterized protein YbaR (Trm112 family)